MRSFSILALIAANLVPLIGVLFYQWDATLVLALFWVENLIIGSFNLVKMLILAARHRKFSELFQCAFFVLHFGLFCAVHGTLLWDLLGLGTIDPGLHFEKVPTGPLALFAEGAVVLLGFIEIHGSTILLGIGALFLSHFVSFIENFILRGEFATLKTQQLMARPYGHILAMHVGLIAGAIAINKFGSTIALLVVMVGFKFAVDIAQHKRRHKSADAELLKERQR